MRTYHEASWPLQLAVEAREPDTQGCRRTRKVAWRSVRNARAEPSAAVARTEPRARGPTRSAEPEERQRVAAVIGVRRLRTGHARVLSEVLAHGISQRARAVAVQNE